MLKRAFKEVILSILPELCILALIVLAIILVIELRNRKAQTVPFWRRVFNAKHIICIAYVVYGYLLLHTTILRREPGLYERRISVDFYFLRAKWYEVFETIENIALFVPIGFLLSRSGFRFVKSIILSFGVSLIIELIQLLSGCGTFEVADLCMNVLGALIGYAIAVLMSSLWRIVSDRFVRKTSESLQKES